MAITGIFSFVISPEITIDSSVKYDNLSVEINMVSTMSSSAKANLGVKLEPKIRNKKTKIVVSFLTREQIAIKYLIIK